MNHLFEKIRSFFKNSNYRNVFLLCLCALLAVITGIGAAFAFHRAAVPVDTSVPSSPSISLTVSNVRDSSSFSSSASLTDTSTESITSLLDSSDSIAEEKEPIPLKLVAQSFTQDLNVNIVDDTGALVRDVLFQLRITGLDKHNKDYDKPFNIDLKDGNLYLSWIPHGNYRISIREEEGFITAEPIEINVKEYVVVYEKIEDIADQIVDESDVNVSEDDNAYGGGGGAGEDNTGTATPPPTTTDTVKYVESSKKTVTEELKDDKGNKLYTYTYEVGPNGFLLLKADNKESDVEPILVDKTLSHGLRYQKIGSTANAPAASTVSFATIESILHPVQLAFFRDENTPVDESFEKAASEAISAVSEESAESASSAMFESSSDSAESAYSEDPSPSTAPSQPESSSASQAPSDTSNTDTSVSAPSSDITDSSDTSSIGSTEDSSSPETYTVQFINPDGNVLHTTSVTTGGTADAPANPSFHGESGKIYKFTGWSAEYSNVRQNLTITAVYDIYSTEKVALFNADNTPISTYKITATVRTQEKTLYTGWQTIDGKTYYYTADNQKVTGWQVIQSISYFFNSDGVRSDCMGIDVSRWNGNINWKKVKEAGIDFAIIRVGYRGYGTGKLVQDPLAVTNLKGATAAGIKIGVYVFSQAITLEEAVEEASMALEMVKGYKLDYPIFIDSEYSTSAKDGRADHISTAQRTAICEAFCKTIANSGYRTGIYASKSWFMYQLNVASLEKYHIWVAHYTTATDYARRYDMWQYTATATVPGISGDVDMNFSYLNY